jgi:hypothetical protein
MPFDLKSPLLRAPEMSLTQLTHGCKIELKSFEQTGLKRFVQATVQAENEQIQILFSGTDYPSGEAYDYFLHRAGRPDDAILMVTGENMNRATEIKAKLQEKGAMKIELLQAIAGNEQSEAIADLIDRSNKIIVVANTYPGLMQFVKGANNGKKLAQKMRQQQVITFFVGDNARFAGTTVVDKYTGSGFTSYHGTLEFLPGLGLLKTTAIMPNTFVDTETYENTVSGLPYAMISDSLKYGLYLTGNTLVRYHCASDQSCCFENVSGSFPLIFLENRGTYTGFANQGPYASSRNVAGFNELDLKFLGLADTVQVGKYLPVLSPFPESSDIRIYPNPASSVLQITGSKFLNRVQIFDMNGHLLRECEFSGSISIDVTDWPQAIYMLRMIGENSNRVYSKKISIIH